MTTSIDTPLLIIGGGIAALLVGQMVSDASLSSLIVGHNAFSGDEAVELDQDSIALLRPHGILNVLNPYAVSQEPLTISQVVFEKVLKHHCVVNMNITVYDDMEIQGLTTEGEGASATLSDGKTQWQVHADRFIDTSELATDLNGAIKAGAALAQGILANL